MPRTPHYATCIQCGQVEDTVWLWSGVCQACWWEPLLTEIGDHPADLPEPAAAVCAQCGHPSIGSDLCSRCDEDIVRAMNRARF